MNTGKQWCVIVDRGTRLYYCGLSGWSSNDENAIIFDYNDPYIPQLIMALSEQLGYGCLQDMLYLELIPD